MAEEIRVEFEKLDEIAGCFDRQSDAVAQMHQRLLAAMNKLEDGGWIGRGSEAFFAEMEGEILPAVRRLIDALKLAHQVTNQISETLQNADEEASSRFRAGDAVGGSPGGSQGTNVAGPQASDQARPGSGAWENGRFTPNAGQDSLAGLFSGRSFTPEGGLGGALGGGLGGAASAASGGNDYGIPGDWLSGVTDSLGGYMRDNYNDHGIPSDWLSGVTDALGARGANDWGIPHDWLSGVTEGVGETSAGMDGGSAGDSGGGGGDSDKGSGSGSGGGGSSGGGGGGEPPSSEDPQAQASPTQGTASAPQTEIRDPFGRGGGFGGDSYSSSSSAGGEGTEGGQPGRMRYQPLSGGVGTAGSASNDAATSGGIRTSLGSSSPVPAVGDRGQGGMGIPIGIAAVSPFIALLGKVIKNKSDDD